MIKSALCYEWRASVLRHSFLAFSISNHHEETTSSTISQYFHNILMISIVSISILPSLPSYHLHYDHVTLVPFPNSIMGSATPVICTSLCISITINDGAHCPHHIFQFHLSHHLWLSLPSSPFPQPTECSNWLFEYQASSLIDSI